MRRFILLCLLLPLWLQAKELVIGGTLEPPLKFLDDQARPCGLDVDVVTAIFNKLNQHFVYGEVWEVAHNELLF